MPIQVYDYRTDLANLIVDPAIRGRFRQVAVGPAPRPHSHDIAGEIFIVLTGQCEFLVEDERVTCGPGQLIYVAPRLRHALHAVGDEVCTIFLCVTPHVEPTHTLYDADDRRLPPAYGTWRGAGDGDPHPDVPTATLSEVYVAATERLAGLAARNAEEARRQHDALAAASGDQPAAKESMDALWASLHDLLVQVSALEASWNSLAPRAMPTTTPPAPAPS
ncbi:MAG: hypothetical protein AVDCRST_MAG18-1857 [uncultured Thermomicrobiales bacterium]|uniref:Cupin type-2 domain-containing protein n=1 Tax=uncultured Thermomicrobiales bacterium TaxID=1645740 RepID=A0A6J4V8B0_9BACT|nr:MAG: hypothetical protein AVDCRST_MAG18-1857 [uncultured Thermomicrobiales bacterium]